MRKLLQLRFAAHACTEAGAAPNSGRHSPLVRLPSLCSRPGRSRLRCASRFQASPSACAPGAHAIRPQVYAARGWSRTCLRSPPRLTLRSWGLPPARHLARAALTVIIRLAGQAPSRRQPLSSNVRQQVAALGCSPSPLGGSRRRSPNALLPRRIGGLRQQGAASFQLRGQGACSGGSVSWHFAGGGSSIRRAVGWSLPRWRVSPLLRPALTGVASKSKSLGGCSGVCASAAHGRFGVVWLPLAAPALQPAPLNSSFIWQQSCLAPRLLPNPSLEWTATGKPAWPRGALCLSCASRPSRLSGARPSAQTLGLTSPKDGTPRLGASQ